MSRLSVLHTESSIGWGGQEIRILSEMSGMQARGHRVHLVTPESAEIYRAAQDRGLAVTAVPIVQKRLPALLALRAWLARHSAEFDVVNTHSSTDSWLAALAGTTLRAMPPIVRTRHVSTAVNRNPATTWLYGRACHIVTTGEALRRQLHRDNGFPLDRMSSIPTGIDLGRFTPGDRHAARRRLGLDARPNLGIVATLRDWKGHDYLLQAFALLRARFPDWRLLVVGDGPCRAHLQGRIGELGLAPDVQLVGNVDNVPDWLAALDLFVLPSYGDEGVPQSIMQAMACGLAVVSTPIGGIPEAVIENETGLLVPPRDVGSLVQALAMLMEDEGCRQAMGSAAVQYARTHFRLEDMLDRAEAVLRRCVRPGRTRP